MSAAKCSWEHKLVVKVIKVMPQVASNGINRL